MTSDPGLLDVGRLRLLHEVGLRGSIAAAARAVGITPSAVSQQLALLERETAVALLDRSPRGVTLTGAGRLLADRAAELLDLLAVAGADLDRISGAVSGHVRVAAVASAAATVVSDAVLALRTAAPDVTVAVCAVEPDRGIAMLLTGDVEIAVVDEYDRVPIALPDGAEIRELDREPLVAVLGPDAPRRRRGVALADLAGSDWVMPPETAACGRAVRAACRAAGFEPRVRWETDDLLLLSGAVAAGHGVTVLPARCVVPGGGNGGVRIVPLADPAPSRRLLAVARSGPAARPSVRAALDAIADVST